MLFVLCALVFGSTPIPNASSGENPFAPWMKKQEDLLRILDEHEYELGALLDLESTKRFSLERNPTTSEIQENYKLFCNVLNLLSGKSVPTAVVSVLSYFCKFAPGKIEELNNTFSGKFSKTSWHIYIKYVIEHEAPADEQGLSPSAGTPV